jgi:hypothetical protein
MAESQFSKIGAAVSTVTVGTSMPAWVTRAGSDVLGKSSNFKSVEFLPVLSKPNGAWLSSLDGATRIRAREMHHILGRYPSQPRRTTNYTMVHEEMGGVRTAYVRITSCDVRRGGPAGPDRGAISGDIWATVVGVMQDGTRRTLLSNGKVISYINSWNQGTKAWDGTWHDNRGFASVEVHLSVYHGDEIRDSVEHGHSAGWWYNPGLVVANGAVNVGYNYNQYPFPVSRSYVNQWMDRYADYLRKPSSYPTSPIPNTTKPAVTSHPDRSAGTKIG